MTADFPSDAERTHESRATAGDDAFARLEKEMAAMKDATGNLSDQIADAASDLGASAQEQAKRSLKYAREYGGAQVDSIVADASDRMGAAASAAQAQAASLADTLEDTVRERPLSAIGVGLGFGFLMGAIWRR
jgi:ElaB/YqjD/DUF883 family membrane-anchored ribosome-binding protein